MVSSTTASTRPRWSAADDAAQPFARAPTSGRSSQATMSSIKMNPSRTGRSGTRRSASALASGRMKRRVRIVQLGSSDEAEFVAAARASRQVHQKWVSPPVTRAAFREKLKRMRGPVNLAYCIRRSDDDALVGYIEITQIVRGPFCSAYLGYYAFAGHARQGLMREGLQQVVRLAFTRLKLHRLEANIQPENVGSIALVKACGFRKEGYSRRYLKIRGRWRDHERWAVLAS